MKEKLNKLANIFKMIFGYGIMIVLFVGGLTFFGYVLAIILGGDAAAAICKWLYKSLIPVMVIVSTVLILFGLLTMYLAGEKALTPEKRKAKDEEKK